MKKKKKTNNVWFNEYFTIYQSPSDMYKKLLQAEDTRNEDQICLIKEKLNEIKEDIKGVFKNRKFMIGDLKKIINIVEYILYFNRIEQKGGELKILTLNQMHSRLPISLAQLNAGNNSKKLQNEIRQLLYSLHRSKKLTKIIYNNLINTIYKNGNNLYEH